MGIILSVLKARPILSLVVCLVIIELANCYLSRYITRIEAARTRDSRKRMSCHSQSEAQIIFINFEEATSFAARMHPVKKSKPIRNIDTEKPPTSSTSSAISPVCTTLPSHDNLQALPMIEYHRENDEVGNEIVAHCGQEADNNIAEANERVENEISLQNEGEVVNNDGEEVEVTPIAIEVEVIKVKRELPFEVIELTRNVPPEKRRRQTGTMTLTMEQITKRPLRRQEKKKR